MALQKAKTMTHPAHMNEIKTNSGPVSGVSLLPEAAEILGFGDRSISEIVLRISADDIVALTTTEYLSEERSKQLLEFVAQYELHPRTSERKPLL